MKPVTFTSLLLTLFVLSFSNSKPVENDKIISYIVNPQKQDLQLYWKDDKGQVIQNFENLIKYVAGKNKKLVFAMNGGMYQPDYTLADCTFSNSKQ